MESGGKEGREQREGKGRDSDAPLGFVIIRTLAFHTVASVFGNEGPAACDLHP